MPTQYKENEYLYSSARVRALELSVIDESDTEHMLNAADTNEIVRIVADKVGIDSRGLESLGTEHDVGENVVNIMLHKVLDNVRDMSPDDNLFKVFTCAYDCNNIKAAVKGYIANLDEHTIASMMIDLGSVPVGDVMVMPVDKNYDLLPEKLAKAAPEALSAYNAGKDPRVIDFILDRACYNDMLSAAYGLGCGDIIEYVKTRIDLTNFLISVRVSRIDKTPVGKALLYQGLIGGGKINPDEFVKAVDDYSKKSRDAFAGFLDVMRKSGYDSFAEAVASDANDLSAIEKQVDNFLVEILRDCRKVPFGAQPLFAYISASEFTAKNIRIILAGKKAGLDRSVIAERVRGSYV